MADLETKLLDIENSLGAGDYHREKWVKWLVSEVRRLSLIDRNNKELLYVCEVMWAGVPDAIKKAIDSYLLRDHEVVQVNAVVGGIKKLKDVIMKARLKPVHEGARRE